jgi:tripartite-type tricarboxylate transporter receptor subunit TctC
VVKLPRRQFLHFAAGAAALPAVSRTAWALDYPARPVRVIVGFTPGGGNDIVARLIGQWLSERLGQPFVIENRPGAGSNIGTQAVVNAAPDGYTLLLCGTTNAINETYYKKLSFSFVRDIAPISSITRQPQVMLAHPSFPAKTLAELIAYAKAKSGQGQHVLGRGRVHRPSRRRTVQDDVGRQHGPRAVRRQQPGLDGLARRPSGGFVRVDAVID